MRGDTSVVNDASDRRTAWPHQRGKADEMHHEPSCGHGNPPVQELPGEICVLKNKITLFVCGTNSGTTFAFCLEVSWMRSSVCNEYIVLATKLNKTIQEKHIRLSVDESALLSP